MIKLNQFKPFILLLSLSSIGFGMISSKTYNAIDSKTENSVESVRNNKLIKNVVYSFEKETNWKDNFMG